MDAVICLVIQPSAQAGRLEIRKAGTAPRWLLRSEPGTRPASLRDRETARPERWRAGALEWGYTELGIERGNLAESETEVTNNNVKKHRRDESFWSQVAHHQPLHRMQAKSPVFELDFYFLI